MRVESHFSCTQDEDPVVTVCMWVIRCPSSSQSKILNYMGGFCWIVQVVTGCVRCPANNNVDGWRGSSDRRTIEDVQLYNRTNAADIMAIGFDLKKTFIFSDYDYMGGGFYRNGTRISKHITLNAARATFGFNDRYLTLCRVERVLSNSFFPVLL